MDIEKITELENTIKKAQAQIEELKKEDEKSTYYPKKGEIIWHLSPNGIVYSREWDGNEYDKALFRQGHIFFTREDADFEKERREVITELEQFKEPEDREWDMNNCHYYLSYSYIDDKIVHGISQCHRPDDIYFETEEDLYEAVKFVGADRIRKYYLRIED